MRTYPNKHHDEGPCLRFILPCHALTSAHGPHNPHRRTPILPAYDDIPVDGPVRVLRSNGIPCDYLIPVSEVRR